ncbi:MAG: AAA-like domain-containing protein [Candidatus Omnitrophota bacterium]
MNEIPVNKDLNMYRKPKRTFEKSGFVDPETSYYVVLENVVNTDNQDMSTMINLGRYFSIFAPRQSGKTTYLHWISDQLHNDPMYVVILLSFQDYNSLDKKTFYSEIEKELYEQLVNRLKEVHCEKTETVQNFLNDHHLVDNLSFRFLFEKLNQILQYKKIVIFIDEFDGIPLDELGNFLTSLRELYQKYKRVRQKALYSVGLIGIRNITKLIVGGVSPFNIADHVDFPRFSLKNVHDLYAQYTQETNQPFTEEAIKKVYEETAGQPWLVNRLGAILTVNVKPGTVQSIDEKDVETAIQELLLEKNDHFDNLYEKAKLYKETFVEIVFDNVKYRADNEDQSWLEQYGLIKRKETKAVVTNNVYKKRFTESFFQ